MIGSMMSSLPSGKRTVVALLTSSGLVLGACGSSEPDTTEQTLTTTIEATHPWDSTSFTQGLEATEAGDLIVGTGMYNQSRIYRTSVDGQQANSHELEGRLFGEGVTVHNDTVWQLTWKAGIAFKRDVNTLEETGRVDYQGEGWGLCSDGSQLVMSDGSGTLTFRNPETFAVTGTVDVTRNGKKTDQLNELDCASDGSVWANVWQTNEIYKIDVNSGDVIAVADTTGILPAADRPGADVLNGIAEIPGSNGQRFYITGKYWNELYEVRFQPK